MTRPELLLHLSRLETAMQKRYTEGFKLVAFDYLGARDANDMRFSVDRIIENEKTLPALSVIMANLPQVERPAQDGPGQSYWDILNARHAEYERVVGDSFENFVRLCAGHRKLASPYFGQAYWRALGLNRYDEIYDQMIADIEAGKEGEFAFLAKERTSTEVSAGLKAFFSKHGFIANRWYWQRFWPQELKQAEAR